MRRLYRSEEHPDQWIGEDEHGVLMLWPRRPRGWAKRTGYTGGKRDLQEVEPALARGTGWPFGGRGPKSRSPSGAVSQMIGLRATVEERAAWERAAGDRRLSDWMRDTNQSTIITSQLPPSKWHEYLGDPTVADAILDRLLHNAHRIVLRGSVPPEG